MERQEQVTCQNLALSFTRIDFNGEGAAAAADDTKLLSDVVVLETTGDARAPKLHGNVNEKCQRNVNEMSTKCHESSRLDLKFERFDSDLALNRR